MKYYYKCNKCGKTNAVNIYRVYFNKVFRDKNTYIRCRQCQNITSIRLCSYIVKDNADKELKKKNSVKILDDWRQC